MTDKAIFKAGEGLFKGAYISPIYPASAQTIAEMSKIDMPEPLSGKDDGKGNQLDMPEMMDITEQSAVNPDWGAVDMHDYSMESKNPPGGPELAKISRQIDLMEGGLGLFKAAAPDSYAQARVMELIEQGRFDEAQALADQSGLVEGDESLGRDPEPAPGPDPDVAHAATSAGPITAPPGEEDEPKERIITDAVQPGGQLTEPGQVFRSQERQRGLDQAAAAKRQEARNKRLQEQARARHEEFKRTRPVDPLSKDLSWAPGQKFWGETVPEFAGDVGEGLWEGAVDATPYKPMERGFGKMLSPEQASDRRSPEQIVAAANAAMKRIGVGPEAWSTGHHPELRALEKEIAGMPEEYQRQIPGVLQAGPMGTRALFGRTDTGRVGERLGEMTRPTDAEMKARVQDIGPKPTDVSPLEDNPEFQELLQAYQYDPEMLPPELRQQVEQHLASGPQARPEDVRRDAGMERTQPGAAPATRQGISYDPVPGEDAETAQIREMLRTGVMDIHQMPVEQANRVREMLGAEQPMSELRRDAAAPASDAGAAPPAQHPLAEHPEFEQLQEAYANDPEMLPPEIRRQFEQYELTQRKGPARFKSEPIPMEEEKLQPERELGDRYAEQKKYWQSIAEGNVGGQHSRGGMITQGMKNRAGNMQQYYNRMTQEGGRQYEQIQAKQRAGQPLSPAEQTFAQRASLYQGTAPAQPAPTAIAGQPTPPPMQQGMRGDANAFNRNMSQAGRRLLTQGGQQQLAHARKRQGLGPGETPSTQMIAQRRARYNPGGHTRPGMPTPQQQLQGGNQIIAQRNQPGAGAAGPVGPRGAAGGEPNYAALGADFSAQRDKLVHGGMSAADAQRKAWANMQQRAAGRSPGGFRKRPGPVRPGATSAYPPRKPVTPGLNNNPMARINSGNMIGQSTRTRKRPGAF